LEGLGVVVLIAMLQVGVDLLSQKEIDADDYKHGVAAVIGAVITWLRKSPLAKLHEWPEQQEPPRAGRFRSSGSGGLSDRSVAWQMAGTPFTVTSILARMTTISKLLMP